MATVSPLKLRLKNPTSVVSKSLIIDYGAEGDGTDDDGPEINAMGAAAAADTTSDHILTIDSGHTFKITTGQFWTQGIRNAIIQGAGATIFRPTSSAFEFGGGYVAALGTSQHAPINSVSRGATSCTLVTAADSSKLTVGRYVCIGGFNTQDGGDPPNLHFFEYVKVVSITGTTTITVTFDRALRLSYLSTWQDIGAARLLVTATQGGTGVGWGGTLRHVGYNVTGEATGGHSKAYDVRLQDMTITCFTPTQCSVAYLKNVTVTSHVIEVDKLCEFFVARDCTVTWIQVQSSSVSLMQLDNVTTTDGTHSVVGTPRHAIIENCTLLDLVPGCYQGNAKTLVVNNCAITTLTFGIASFDRTGASGTLNMQSVYSMSGGMITIPRSVWVSLAYPPCYVPGCVGFFAYNTRNFGPSFKVLSVTYDVTNIYVQTSLAGTWPTVPSGVKAIYMHPCPKLTMNGCTVDATAIDLSNAPDGAPAGTYTSRSYNKSHTGAQQAFPFMVGRVVSITIDVTVAHTSAMTAHMFDLPVLTSAGTEVRYDVIIDCARVATRVITPSGVTGNGGSDGLIGTLTLPTGAWLVGAAFSGFNSFVNITATASPFACTITITTDQEVTADDDPDYAELVAMAEALN